MKTIFKTTAATLSLLALTSPLAIFAETPEVTTTMEKPEKKEMREEKEGRKENKGPQTNKNFCATIDTVGAKILAEVNKKDLNLKSKKSDRLLKVEDNRKERDLKLSNERGIRSTKNDSRYTSLTNKATTDAQKAAVAAFKTASDAAIAKRQSAVDTAIAAYRTAADALIASKQGGLDTSIATFQTSINSAIATAKASCTAGSDSATTKQTFQASIKTARKLLKQLK